MNGVIHIDYAVRDDCINKDSYGVVCLKCNACGRFDMHIEFMKESQEKEVSDE